MLAINPTLVKFGAKQWPDVTLVAIDRTATRLAADWTDTGPHPTFVDAPEQRTEIKVVRAVMRDDLDDPRPGQIGTLTFHASPGGTDAGRVRISVNAVVAAVRHEFTAKGASRIVQLLAVSPDGATDPVTISGDEP